MVFRLLDGRFGGAVTPAISSNTGLSMEYADAGELTGDFERFMFVKRLMRLAVVDDGVDEAFASFLLIPVDWPLVSILDCVGAVVLALFDFRPKKASTC